MPSTTVDSAASITVTEEPGGSVVVLDPSPAALFRHQPQWRYLITDLDGVHITTLDALARDRSITYELNRPTQMTGTVSSDNHEVNEIHTDGFPFLAEGDRLLYCFRRDYNGDPANNAPWTIRAAGIVLQYDDSGDVDEGNTTFTAFDPWQYLFALPIPNTDDPDLTGNINLRYVRTRVDLIIQDLLLNAFTFYNTDWPPAHAVANMFLDWENGVYEELDAQTITFPKGQTIGEAFQVLCDRGYCDIVIDPIYDPINFPGYLGRLNVYETTGEERPEAIFAWDKPSHSTSSVSRMVDGTRRKNKLRLHVTQGGDSTGTLTENASVNRFGQYWSEGFLPQEEHSEGVNDIAHEILDTYSEHARTVSLGAVPERSPSPFLEYYLGDSVRVFASPNLRALMSGFQRVSGFTLSIADDQFETVTDLQIYIPSVSESS